MADVQVRSDLIIEYWPVQETDLIKALGSVIGPIKLWSGFLKYEVTKEGVGRKRLTFIWESEGSAQRWSRSAGTEVLAPLLNSSLLKSIHVETFHEFGEKSSGGQRLNSIR